MSQPATHSTRPRARWCSTSLGIAALASMTLAACSGNDGTPTIRLSQDDPDLAPSADSLETAEPTASVVDLEFSTFDGSTRTMGEVAGGQPLVINFFAAWCGPCIAEMPDLEEVYQEVKNDVVFLGLAQDQAPGAAIDMVARTGVSYDIGWDPALDVYLEFGGFSMPTTVFVGPDGKVAEVFPGALTADAIRKKVDSIRS